MLQGVREDNQRLLDPRRPPLKKHTAGVKKSRSITVDALFLHWLLR